MSNLINIAADNDKPILIDPAKVALAMYGIDRENNDATILKNIDGTGHYVSLSLAELEDRMVCAGYPVFQAPMRRRGCNLRDGWVSLRAVEQAEVSQPFRTHDDVDPPRYDHDVNISFSKSCDHETGMTPGEVSVFAGFLKSLTGLKQVSVPLAGGGVAARAFYYDPMSVEVVGSALGDVAVGFGGHRVTRLIPAYTEDLRQDLPKNNDEWESLKQAQQALARDIASNISGLVEVQGAINPLWMNPANLFAFTPGARPMSLQVGDAEQKDSPYVTIQLGKNSVEREFTVFFTNAEDRASALQQLSEMKGPKPGLKNAPGLGG